MRFLYLAIPLLPLQNIIDKIDAPLAGLPGVNFQNLLVLFLLFLWLSRTVMKGEPLVRRSAFNKVLGLYFVVTYLGLWRAVTYVDSPAPLSPFDPSLVYWKDYMTALLLFFVMSTLVESEERMRRLTAAMFMFLPYMIFVHRDHLSHANSWHYDDDMRVSGTFMHLGSNELAAFYAIALMVVVGLLIHMKGVKWKVYLWGVFALLSWGVFYSYSRSSYVACIAGAAVVGLYKNRRLVLLLAAMAAASPWILPVSVQERFGMIDSEQTQTDRSTTLRIELWDVAKRRYAENPVLGTGLRSFRRLNEYGMDTHNMYLKLLCELGTLGFLLFVAQFVAGFVQASRLYKVATTPFSKGLALGLMAAVVAAAILNLFGDRSSYLAITAYWWCWHGMAARALRGIEDGEPGWTTVEVDDAQAIPG